MNSTTKLDSLSEEAATALVVAIEGEGQRDPATMRRLTTIMRGYITAAHFEGRSSAFTEVLKAIREQSR